MSQRFPVALPKPGTLIRTIVDYVNAKLPSSQDRTVSLFPLVLKYGIDPVNRRILTLRRDYRWFIRRTDQHGSNYEFGQWAEYTLVTTEDPPRRIYHTDPRWKPVTVNPPTQLPRKTIFRPEPAQGTEIGKVYRFLLNNREPRTNIVNVQSLYDKWGSRKVSGIFLDLRKFYGFSIASAGVRAHFVVRREHNLKSKIWRSPIDSPDYGIDQPSSVDSD